MINFLFDTRISPADVLHLDRNMLQIKFIWSSPFTLLLYCAK